MFLLCFYCHCVSPRCVLTQTPLMKNFTFNFKPSIRLRCNQRDGDCVNHRHPHRPVVLCPSVLLLLQEVCRLCKVKIFFFGGGVAVVCHWPVCYGVSACRHSAIFCPVIPDPSVMFKEIINGNKELKVYFRVKKSNLNIVCLCKHSSHHYLLQTKSGSLYQPVEEHIESCKILHVQDSCVFQQKS